MAKQFHKHCWHDDGAWWNGMCTDGELHRICCHCGERQSRRARAIQDPKHGSYGPLTQTIADSKWYPRKET